MRRREFIALLGSSAVILPGTTFAVLPTNADLSGYRSITETNCGRIKWWK
jgi:hypothetical protein